MSFYNDSPSGSGGGLSYVPIWNLAGAQLYSGPENSPSFVPGVYSLYQVNDPQNIDTVTLSIAPVSAEFAFHETAPEGGNLGYYTITNNSSDWWITGFDVYNPLAGDPYEPSTTQTDWTA
jgi:hypothetical protein